MQRALAYPLGLVIVGLAITGAFSAPAAPDARSWKNCGNGLHFGNYSAADQINTSIVKSVVPVWNYQLHHRGRWEMTTIVAGGTLYGGELEGNAFALDSET